MFILQFQDGEGKEGNMYRLFAMLRCATLLFVMGCSIFRVEIGNSGEGTGKQKRVVSSEREAYRCCLTSEPIKVDGFLDEPAWEKAKALNFTLPGTLKEPVSRTEARILYDNKYLYVGIKAYDQNIWATYTEQDSIVYEEDALEIVLKTDPEKDPYYEFEVSPLWLKLNFE